MWRGTPRCWYDPFWSRSPRGRRKLPDLDIPGTPSAKAYASGGIRGRPVLPGEASACPVARRHETLVLHPASTSHLQLGAGGLSAVGISAGAIRISVGIEDVDDLRPIDAGRCPRCGAGTRRDLRRGARC
ncbi:PLP-dependent transferase [Micromonospora sp. KC723]|uniref:PLP-dependent transferase n=1 Tax=Micromonospora sp. KC723 TaxID=2530381 RepID=UPI001A9D488C|nr:PLP-dependent transferase [Micromonospora sp. KC723]